VSKLAWVIGTGPSLRNIDMSKLIPERTITFNRAYVAFEDWGFEPSYYLAIDSNDIRAMYKDINTLIGSSNIEKFFLSPCEDNSIHTAESFQDQEKVSSRFNMFLKSDKVHYIEHGSPFLEGTAIDNTHKILNTKHHPNAGWLGVKALYAMGYNEVAFVGCDSRYKDDEESNKHITKLGREYISHADYDMNHFRDDYFGKGMRFGKPNQAQIISIWKSGKKEIDRMDNFKVYSCTENSTLNDFYDYIPFEEFLGGKR
tara:strand:- start:1726 stop:2496 length:771 start_codon:yes stop_codon:yes gene_type:complete